MNELIKLAGAVALLALISGAMNRVAADEPEGKCWVCSIHPPGYSPQDPRSSAPDSPQNPHDDDPAIDPPDVIPEDTRHEPLFNDRDCDKVHDLLLNCNHLET